MTVAVAVPAAPRPRATITPTIGRVVWYRQNNAAPPHPLIPAEPVPPEDQAQPQAAIIVYVNSDTDVNLVVFATDGTSSGALNVPLYSGEGDLPETAYCE
jgi:hypothetical protein